MTHICVSKLTIIGSDKGLPPDRSQAIIRTNAGILLIGPLGINICETSSKCIQFIQENAFEIVVQKLAAILSWPQCVKQIPMAVILYKKHRMINFYKSWNDIFQIHWMIFAILKVGCLYLSHILSYVSFTIVYMYCVNTEFKSSK